MRWVAAWMGPSEVDAELTAGQLRAAGIAAVVEGSQSPYRGAAFPLGGTWQILVPEAQAEEARKVLIEAGQVGNVVAARDDGGLLTSDQRATLVAAAVGGAMVVIVVLLLLLREGAG